MPTYKYTLSFGADSLVILIILSGLGLFWLMETNLTDKEEHILHCITSVVFGIFIYSLIM